MIGCKGLAYAISLGTFRGGPVFPALFLGTAVGLLVDGLPGFSTTPAVAVGIGAATAAGLRLPLTAVVLATVLCAQPAYGAAPLVIVGVVVAYMVTIALPSPRRPSRRASSPDQSEMSARRMVPTSTSPATTTPMKIATIPATAPTKKKQMRATASQITTAIASSAPIRSETSGESG